MYSLEPMSNFEFDTDLVEILTTTGTADSDKLRIVGQATRFGSIYPAIWNFMLAARTCGIASKITTLHLLHEQEAADVLGIPFSEYMQCGLIPLGYAKSPVYKPAYWPPIANVLHYNKW